MQINAVFGCTCTKDPSSYCVLVLGIALGYVCGMPSPSLPWTQTWILWTSGVPLCCASLSGERAVVLSVSWALRRKEPENRTQTNNFIIQLAQFLLWYAWTWRKMIKQAFLQFHSSLPLLFCLTHCFTMFYKWQLEQQYYYTISMLKNAASWLRLFVIVKDLMALQFTGLC